MKKSPILNKKDKEIIYKDYIDKRDNLYKVY